MTTAWWAFNALKLMWRVAGDLSLSLEISTGLLLGRRRVTMVTRVTRALSWLESHGLQIALCS